MAKILVAEDDRDAAVLMQLVLKKAGHQVRLVGSGRAVLDACAEESPDLLLLDVAMPELDGYEVARRLKERAETRDVPLVFVTGSSETRSKVAGLTVGANDYITKPFHRDELLARVAVALRIKQQTDDLKAANAQLAALSLLDSLTNLYNRRHLDQRLEEEVARANRYGGPLTCLMLDIDRFKSVNDRYGHQEGDAVLRMVANVLRQATRISDVVGRYGGEEFTILAPETDLAAGAVLAERIRSSVAAQEVLLDGEKVRVTISIGLAQHVRRDTGADLIAAADGALYAAKAAGRDRVVIAGVDSPRRGA